MKEIFKIIIGFAIALTIFSSCSEDANLPTPDGLTEGITFTVNMNDNSDGNINVFDFASVQLALDVAHIEGDYSTVELMFSLNNDFSKQYKLVDITTFPSVINFDVFDIVAACEDLSDTTDIFPGDVFTFYINVLGTDGVFYYGYHPETGRITQSPAQRNIEGQNFNINFLVACPYIPANFVGLYDVVETGPDGSISNYQSNVTIDPNNPENGLICTEIWWGSDPVYPCFVTIYIDLDTYQVLGEDQIIWGGNAFELGRVGISNFTPGLANTCTFSFWFTGDPDLPDVGYWWGGPATWELTPATKKSENIGRVVKTVDYVTKY